MENYDSLYTGKQIDDAVGAVYGFSKELNNKLDKSKIEPYIIENNEFDTGLNELSVRQNDENKEPFSTLTVQAPKANPKEATLCLKVPFSGNNADETYFMDISCMNYGNPDESPEQSIYVNSRGNANLPNFNIGFTNNENQIRHKKLIITPDALPMMFKSDGILVKNTNDPSIHNWSDATLIDIRDINKKLNKFTDTKLKVYSHGMKEELDFNEYITPTDQAYANTLVMRDRNGKFRSVTPNITIIDNTVATTEFVNSYANEKTVKLEPTNPNQNYDNSIYQIYGHMPLSAAEGIKGNLTYCFNISNVPQFSNIPQYNEEGRLKTNAPFEDNDVTNKKYVDNKIEKSMSEVLEVAEGKTKTIVINHTDTLQTLKSANSVYIIYPDGNTRDVTNDIKKNDYDGYTFGNTVFGNQNDTYIICDFLIFRNNPFKNNSSITSDYYIFQWSIYKSYLNIGDIFLNMLTDVPDFWLQDSTSGKIGILETRKIELSNIDTDFSLTSTNPIQNKVITNAINGIGADIEQIQGQVNNNEQDIGAINSTIVKDYTNPNGDMTVNKGLTVSTNGDATVGRNLTIKGKTKLNSGLAPIHTYSFQTKVLDIYWENLENTISGVSTYSYIGVIHGFIDSNSQDVFGTYKIEGTTLKLVSIFYYNENGLQQTIWNLPNGGLETHVYVTDGKLDTIGQKQVDGSVIYNDSLTVEASGNVNVPENLLVQGATELRGGMKPMRTITFYNDDGTENSKLEICMEVPAAVDPEGTYYFNYFGTYYMDDGYNSPAWGYYTKNGDRYDVNIETGGSSYYYANSVINSSYDYATRDEIPDIWKHRITFTAQGLTNQYFILEIISKDNVEATTVEDVKRILGLDSGTSYSQTWLSCANAQLGTSPVIHLNAKVSGATLIYGQDMTAAINNNVNDIAKRL